MTLNSDEGIDLSFPSVRRISQETHEQEVKSLSVDVDLVLAAATWDSRCLNILQLSYSTRLRQVVVLNFSDKGTSGRSVEHELILHRQAVGLAGVRAIGLDVDSRDIAATWSLIRSMLQEAYQEVKRPVKILIDLNSVPRYLSLAILGLAKRTGIVSQLSYLYSTAASYVDLAAENASTALRFTDGDWLPKAVVPLGEGAPGSASSHLFVLAGFDGANTRRVVGALEPDSVSVGLSRGIDTRLEEYALEINQYLLQDYLLSEQDVIDLPVSSVRASIWAIARSLQPKGPRDTLGAREEAVSFLLSGTKISALAAAVYALDNPVSQVYYAMPARRFEVTASATSMLTLIEVAV